MDGASVASDLFECIIGGLDPTLAPMAVDRDFVVDAAQLDTRELLMKLTLLFCCFFCLPVHQKSSHNVIILSKFQ